MNAPATPPPSVLERIAAATLAAGTLGKDKTNKHDGYDYLSEEKVKQCVQRLIAEHRIAPDSITFEIISDAWVKSSKGVERNLIKLRCTLKWEGIGPTEGLGAGIDYGDKALMKAQTSALREAWKNRLTIPTGQDPERDDDRDEPREPRARGNGNGRPAPANTNGSGDSKLAADLRASLISELQKCEHPGDLKNWADGIKRVAASERGALWDAFGTRCKALQLDPGKVARGQGAPA